MWNTPQGVRVLTGAEAALVQDAVSVLADFVHEEASGYGATFKHGIALFDQLSWTERLTELDRVATALLTASGPVFQPSAVHEAVVGAIFSTVESMVHSEIRCDEPGDQAWRSQVLAACHESLAHKGAEAIECLPVSSSVSDPGIWSDTIEVLADQILWDRDYQLAGDFLDTDPEKAALIREVLGIDDDYFVDAAQDVSEQSVDPLLRHLRQLTQDHTDESDDDSVPF
ncbi:MAG: hypothetical protein R3C59_11510 [Planctomycetaceae bacterium]